MGALDNYKITHGWTKRRENFISFKNIWISQVYGFEDNINRKHVMCLIIVFIYWEWESIVILIPLTQYYLK